MSTTAISPQAAPKQRRNNMPVLDPANPPPMVTRADAATLLYARLGLKVSRRTLEAWPLGNRQVNGRVLLNTDDVLAHGRAMIDASATSRGGRGRGRRCFVQRQDAA